MKGITIFICIGQWVKPSIIISNSEFRILIGWLSFGIIFYDIEVALQKLLNLIKYYEQAIDWFNFLTHRNKEAKNDKQEK